MKKRFAVGLSRSDSPQSGSTNLPFRFGRQTFTQDARPGADVVQKIIAIRMKFFVPQCFRHTEGFAVNPLARARRDKFRQVARGAANRSEYFGSLLDLFGLFLPSWEETWRCG